jgi:hypothetical protein
MQIPKWMLRESLIVYPNQGRGFAGATYGDDYSEMNARVEMGYRRVVDSNGQDVVIDGTVYLHPNDEMTVGDKVVMDGQAYAVVSVLPMSMRGRLHHRECSIKSIGKHVHKNKRGRDDDTPVAAQVLRLHVTDNSVPGSLVEPTAAILNMEGAPWEATTLAMGYAEWDSAVGGNIATGGTWIGEIENGTYTGCTVQAAGGLFWSGSLVVSGSTLDPTTVVVDVE